MNKHQRYNATPHGKAMRKKWKESHREVILAQNKALYKFKEAVCSVRGCEEIAQRHHKDYSKPLDIVMLCRKHHLEVHGKVRKNCTICGIPQDSKGLCKKHYAQKYRKEQGW